MFEGYPGIWTHGYMDMVVWLYGSVAACRQGYMDILTNICENIHKNIVILTYGCVDI